VRKANFDAADRPIRETTGAVVNELLGAATASLHEGTDRDALALDNKSVVTTRYTARGTVRAVNGSYGDLVAGVKRDADGLVAQIEYGDLAKTTTAFSYDNRRRLRSVQTYRGPPNAWTTQPSYLPAPEFGSATPSSFQLLLADEDYTYDSVDNPTEIRDWRLPDEWPAGAKPVTRQMEYDDLYRVTQVDYRYAGGDDTWVSPFAAEEAGDSSDPRRAQPSPHVAFDKRVLRQTFAYDWLGNTSKTTDDSGGFYDRSLGSVTNDLAHGKPYQLGAASNEATAAASTRKGHLSATYDDAGNLTAMVVVRNGPCLGTKCAQQFTYDWDEVGRLVQARRWDFESQQSPPPVDTPASATLQYAYDHSDTRVRKTALDANSNALSTLYVFASFELRRATFTVGGDYDREAITEVPYLFAHGVRLARVVFEPAQVPSFDPGKPHVFLELGDHLGSNNVVLDKATGELVERGTYEAYGATESDYRPARWNEFREDYRFTGKEGDVEVGTVYFGARFYVPSLGRWANADPLAVHTNRGDLNLYAYVHGQVLKAIDPLGLDEACQCNLPQEDPAAGMTHGAAVSEQGTMSPGVGVAGGGGGAVPSRGQPQEASTVGMRAQALAAATYNAPIRLGQGIVVLTAGLNGDVRQTETESGRALAIGEAYIGALQALEDLKVPPPEVETERAQRIGGMIDLTIIWGAPASGATGEMRTGTVLAAESKGAIVQEARAVEAAVGQSTSTTSVSQASGIPGDAFVVRGGVATPEQIAQGIGPHRDVPGLIGFSAQSRAGATVHELASTGGIGNKPFPHGKVSVTTAGQLRCIGCEVIPSPGAGANHVTVTPGPATPAKISEQFIVQPNPARAR